MIRGILYSSDESDSEQAGNVPRKRKVYKIRRNFELNDEFSFKESFRMTKRQTEFILEKIGRQIKNRNGRNYSLDANQQLLITLHWLGNGSQYHGVASMHGVDKSTVCRTVHKVVNAVVNTMLQSTVCWPSTNTNDIALQFYQKGGFPSVCGCVDGTLIPIDAPYNHEENYVDRHGNHSLNTMMVCGPNYYFYSVNASWPGSVHDSRVLRNTALYRKFEEGWRPFPGAVILGDSAYPTKNWLIPPIRRHPDDVVERRFNIHHKRTRRLIEDTYGILKEKFPCLNHLRVQPEKAAKIVIACCILHNVARVIDREDVHVAQNYEETDYDVDLGENIEHSINNFEPSTQGRINEILQFFR